MPLKLPPDPWNKRAFIYIFTMSKLLHLLRTEVAHFIFFPQKRGLLLDVFCGPFEKSRISRCFLVIHLRNQGSSGSILLFRRKGQTSLIQGSPGNLAKLYWQKARDEAKRLISIFNGKGNSVDSIGDVERSRKKN